MEQQKKRIGEASPEELLTMQGKYGKIKVVEVEDDGIGLPRRILEDPSNLRGSGHYGLCGVQERLASMGWRLSLRAREAGGTRIRAWLFYTSPSPRD